MKENIGTDINGRVDYTLPRPIACWDIPLTANVVGTVTAPPGFNRAFFGYSLGSNVWVTLDGSTPVVPASSSASTQELLPAGRQIINDGTQVIKFISDTTAIVNIRFDQGT